MSYAHRMAVMSSIAVLLGAFAGSSFGVEPPQHGDAESNSMFVSSAAPISDAQARVYANAQAAAEQAGMGGASGADGNDVAIGALIVLGVLLLVGAAVAASSSST